MKQLGLVAKCIKMGSCSPSSALLGNLFSPKLCPVCYVYYWVILNQVFSAISDPELRPPIL